MLASSNYYVQELYDRASQKNSYILILFLSSLGTIILSIPILLPAVNSVNKAKDRVLTLFIEIPNVYVTELGKRCELFLNSFYSEQSEDIKSVEDTDSKANDEGSSDVSLGSTKR